MIMDTNKATYENTAAVVMNDYIDGLGLVRSLRHDERVRIILVGRMDSIASRSKYLTELHLFETPDEQLRILEMLNERFRVCIPYPAGDNYFRLLVKNREKLDSFSIPWETDALLDKDGRPLVEKAAVCVAPSLALLQALADRRELGNVPNRALVMGIRAFDGRHAPLPFAPQEARMVSEHLDYPSVLLLDDEASGARLRQKRALGRNRYRLLHLATHGFSDVEHGRLAGIALADEDFYLHDLVSSLEYVVLQ